MMQPSPRTPHFEDCCKGFPLNDAYPFAGQHGLSAEAAAIKKMQTVKWSKSYTSSIRRGRMIKLFEGHEILEKFIDKAWPFGRTAGGETAMRRHVKISEEYGLFLKQCGAPVHTTQVRREERPAFLSRAASTVVRPMTPVSSRSARVHASTQLRRADVGLHSSPNFESIVRPLLTASADPGELSAAYALYVQSVVDAPLWSPDQPSAVRIPWRITAQAAKHPLLAGAFGSPGVYLFGDSTGTLLYLGMTRRTLLKRLQDRYVRGGDSQCQLAVDYERDLISRGLDGFPTVVRDRTSIVRRRGAVRFAQSGIEGIWFTLLPVPESSMVRDLEKKLIRVANQWNCACGHPFMLNDRDT